METKDLVLIGGGKFAAEVAEVAVQVGYAVAGYLDVEKTDSELPYLGTEDEFMTENVGKINFFPAFGSVDRKGMSRRDQTVSALGKLSIPSLISPHALVSGTSQIGRGVFIAHNVVVNHGAHVGDFCILNTSSVVGHDVVIGESAVISGNAFIGGDVKIGRGTLIGPGANIIQGISIGDRVVISIGSVVARSIGHGKTTRPKLSKVI